MKKILSLLFALSLLGCKSLATPNPGSSVTVNSNSELDAGFKVKTGETVELESGATLQIDSGASLTGASIGSLATSGSPASGDLAEFNITSGVTTVTSVTGAANQVLATPNGASGKAVVRSLVGADLPPINLAASGPGGVTGTLSPANLPAWTGANFIMVQTANAGVQTTLQHVAVNAGGTGYPSGTTATCTGGGATTQATLSVNVTSGVITSITIVTPGAGYTSVPTITITGTGGSGALVTPYLCQDPFTNGLALLNAVTQANSITSANGGVLGVNNEVNILIPPGVYDLDGSRLQLNSYVNLIGWPGSASSTVVGDSPVIRSASQTAYGVVTLTSGGVNTLQNLRLNNSASAATNTSQTSTNPCVIYCPSSGVQNLVMDHVAFTGTNCLSAGVNLSTTSKVTYCFTGPIRAPNTIAGDWTGTPITIVGDPAAYATVQAYELPGTVVTLTDTNVVPYDQTTFTTVGITYVLASTVDYNTAIGYTNGGIWKDCTFNITGSHAVLFGGTTPLEFINCKLTGGSVSGAVVCLETALFKGGVITPGTSTWVIDINGKEVTGNPVARPAFYGVTFTAPLPVSILNSSTGAVSVGTGVVDLQHCELPSNWGTPTGLAYATSNTASTTTVPSSNYISVGTNWNQL